MQSSYTTYDAAKTDLIEQGFVRYLSPINGAERFSKASKVDDALGGYARECLVRIKHHWVAPQWGDSLNYFTVDFL